MTITYTNKVPDARLCGFPRLLLHWKGSIYKLMYKEMMLFVGLYTTFSLIYRLALPEHHKRSFEKVVIYCKGFADLIPISFVLGFYVSIVVTRWWNQYMNIPWPDRLMINIGTMVHGCDETGRIIRRTLVRYLHMSLVMIMQSVSTTVKKRFPTVDHLVAAGRFRNSLRGGRLICSVPNMFFIV
ncbi:unnamed protein product [Owenia fusiformis]|uniref:Bestrophin homolog n=1 Tax=Owenia fusiformis TaxID=6347 RepID=A0A8S4Q0B7_OWEFU|nr:unnamed protein product [Owenia fusiformis]